MISDLAFTSLVSFISLTLPLISLITDTNTLSV